MTLGRVFADLALERRRDHGAPRRAVVLRGHVLKRRPADLRTQPPEKPELAVVVPEKRRGVRRIHEIGPWFGHVPFVRAMAQPQHGDRLVHFVLPFRRVVVGRHQISVVEHLDGRVVPHLAESRHEADLPADGVHFVFTQVREHRPGAIERLRHVGPALQVGRLLLDGGLEKILVGRGGLRRRQRRLHHAETDVPLGRVEIRRGARAVGGATVIRLLRGKLPAAIALRAGPMVVAATAHHLGVAARRADRIGLRRSRVAAVPVQAPFRDRGLHVFHAPGIGDPLGRRFRPGREHRPGAGAAGKLPLRLGRQAVGLAFLFAQPFAEGHGVLPADTRRVGRPKFALLIIRPELAELFDRDLRLADQERTRNSHLVHRHFVVIALLVGAIPGGPAHALGEFQRQRSGIDAHLERARRDRDQGHAQGIGRRLSCPTGRGQPECGRKDKSVNTGEAGVGGSHCNGETVRAWHGFMGPALPQPPGPAPVSRVIGTRRQHFR